MKYYGLDTQSRHSGGEGQIYQHLFIFEAELILAGTNLTRRSRIKVALAGIALFITVTAAGSWLIDRYERELIEQSAVETGQLYLAALSEFRTIYMSEVVEHVRAQGVRVTHDYSQDAGAIPLPVTLSMEFARRIGARGRVTPRLSAVSASALADLLTEIIEATQRGDASLLEQLAGRVAERDAVLGAALRALVADFEYERFLTLAILLLEMGAEA